MPIDTAAALLLLALVMVLVRVARHHRFHGKPFFLASLVGAALWLTAVTLEHRAIGEACKLFWATTAWAGIGLLPTALCFFIDDYARARDSILHKGRLLALLGGPLSILTMAGTNAWHGLFYGPGTVLAAEGPGGQVAYEHGPLFYLAAAWLYVFVAAGMAMLLRGLRGAHPAHRPFFLAWLLVLILPIAVNLGYVIGGVTVSGMDPTAYVYALALMVLAWFIITDRMLDLRAVALEVLWRNTPAPIMVVMPDGAVASANPAALALCGRARNGEQLTDWGALEAHAATLMAPDPPDDLQTLRLDKRCFDLRILPIETPLGEPSEMGRVLLFNDITLRQELEARLGAERDYLQLLMQTTMTGILAFDDAGRVIFANAEVGKLTGRCTAQITGMGHAALFPPIEGEDGQGVVSFAAAIGASERQRGLQVGFRRADGAARVLSVNVAHIDRAGVQARVVCALADITEALETARSLAAARNRAEAANRTKSQFLANMSHEIRTPLNGVLGMAELLEDRLEDPQARSMARTIRDSGATLLSVLNDVLDMSKIEAGKMQIEARPFAPAEIAARTEALHAGAAEEKGLAFRVQGPGREVPARLGDLHRILQVVHNLVCNAIKFTQAGGVTVQVRAAEGAAMEIEVRDTGIGMDARQAARIFTEFEQGDGSVARRFGGTGLGMTITRGLVDQMGGEIDLDTAPGRGTCVRVRLPLAECVEPPAEPGPQADGHGFDAAPGADGGAPARPLAGLSLLVADDNAVNRALLEMMLERAGASVRMVEGGQAALAAWQPDVFDLVLLDISMPDLDGISTLAALRRKALKLGAEPPVALAITANVMTHQIAEYRAAGFAGHAGKPFQSARLVAEILRLVRAGAGAPCRAAG